MMLEEELRRILNNLTLNGDPEENNLVDLRIEEKKENLLQIVDASDLETNAINVIDKKELNRYEQVLRNEIAAIWNIQQAVLRDDSEIGERIAIQQRGIDYRYNFNDLNDAIYRFDYIFDGLFWKFRNMLVNLCKGNLFNEKAIVNGDILIINLGNLHEAYHQLIMQLKYIICCHELDTIRNELVNIVKYITIKTEKEDR